MQESMLTTDEQIRDGEKAVAQVLVLDEGNFVPPESISSLRKSGVAVSRGVGMGRYGSIAMLPLAAGAGLERITLHESIHGIDEAEPPKPKSPRTTWGTCWTYTGVQQYHVGDDGDRVPVRLNDPKGNLKERRKLLRQKQRGK